MPNMPKSVRNMTVTTESGKDFRDTMVVSGSAKKTSAESATNVTTQYAPSGGNRKPPLGGKNSNS
jgi:hypothetical protein